MSDAPVVTAEDLVGVVGDLWRSVSPDPDAEDAPVPADWHPRGARVLRSSIGIEGSWDGDLVVTSAPGAAERWARAMLAIPDEEPVTETDALDVLAEVANVIGGAVKAHCAAGGRLGLPDVGVDESDAGPPPEDVLLVGVPMTWPDAPLGDADAVFTLALVHR
ncbi:chemotaxis protein CheX [uncultured Pseudokineococcus sp.]|uniref:chemotaxis protein CheX n=1 Tax=uncultured Pseudokineococcus sp. TaxID=1642928 RepID=UPI002610E885|nr:chemotaxis protein CheX [uncultured Pseudokineococcus sp.]